MIKITVIKITGCVKISFTNGTVIDKKVKADMLFVYVFWFGNILKYLNTNGKSFDDVLIFRVKHFIVFYKNFSCNFVI